MARDLGLSPRDNSSKTRPWRKWPRRILRAFLLLVAAVLFLVTAYVIFVNYKGESARKHILAELRQRKLPTGLDYLKGEEEPFEDTAARLSGQEFLRLMDSRSKAPSAPAAPNGAGYYLAAFELARYLPEASDDIPYVSPGERPTLGGPVSQTVAERIGAFLETREDFLWLMAKARRFTRFSYPLEGDEGPPGCWEPGPALIPSARILALLSLHRQASNDADGALDACEAILDMNASFDGRPSEWLWRTVSSAMAYLAAQDTLSRTTPGGAALRSLRQKVANEAENTQVSGIIAYEIASPADSLQHMGLYLAAQDWQAERMLSSAAFVIPAKLDERPGASAGESAGSLRWWLAVGRLWSTVCPGAYKLMFVSRIERRLRDYDDAQVPMHEQAARAKRLLAARPTDDREEAPWLRSILAAIEHQARMRVTAAALSVELHRIDHGAWPQKLTDAEGAPLEDPFSGRGLVYERTGNGCVVYSIGENQRDDGGERDAEQKDDLAFRLFDVRVRNQL